MVTPPTPEVESLQRQLAQQQTTDAASRCLPVVNPPTPEVCAARCRGCGEMIPLDQALIEQHRQQCCARRGLESIAPQVNMINIEVQPLEKEGSWPRGRLDEMPIFFKRGFGKVSRILCYGDESVAGRCLSGGADGAPDEFEPPGRALCMALQAAGVSCEVAVCGLSGLGPAALVSSIGAAFITDESGHVGRGLIPVLEQGEPYDLVVISVSPRAISQPATIYTELCRLHQACHARKTPTVVLVPPSGLIIPGGPETSRSAATPVQTRQRLSAQTLNNLLARWVKATPQAVAFHDMSKFGCEGGEQSVPCSGGQLWSGGGRSLTPVGFRALGQQLATAILPHLGPGVQSDQKSIAAMSSGGLSQSQLMAVSRSPSQGSAFSVSRTPPRFIFGPRQKDVGSPREANTEKACKELEGKHDTTVEGFAERMKALSALLQARDQEVSETVASFDELKEAYRKCEADAESVLQKVADHGSDAAQRESAYQELEMRHHAEVGEAARLNKALIELRQECGQDLQERAAQQDALRKAYHNCEAALSQALADHAKSVEQQQELQLKCTAATTQTDKCLAACQHLERNCAEAVEEVQDSHRKSEKDAEAALSHATAHHASEIERHEAAYQQLHRRHAAAAEEVTEYLAKVKRMDELDVQVGELRQACSKYESDAAAALSQTMAVHSSELAQREEANQVLQRRYADAVEEANDREKALAELEQAYSRYESDAAAALSQTMAVHSSELAQREEANQVLQRRYADAVEEANDHEKALAELERARELDARQRATSLEQMRELYRKKEADAVNTLSGNLQELHEKRMADAEEAALQEEAHRQLHMEHAAAVEEARECERAIAQLRSARDVDAQEAAEAKRELEQAVAQVERARDHAVEEGARRLGELEESHRRSLEAAAAALARAVEEHGADAAQRRAACQELERRHAEAAEEAGRRGEACSELGRALEAARREGAAALLEAQGAHRRSEEAAEAALAQAAAQHGSEVERREAAYQELQRRHAAATEEAEKHEKAYRDLQDRHAGLTAEAGKLEEGLAELQRARDEAVRAGHVGLEEMREAQRRCQEDSEADFSKVLQELQEKHSALQEAVKVREQECQALQGAQVSALQEAAQHEGSLAELQASHDLEAREARARQEELARALAELQRSHDEAVQGHAGTLEELQGECRRREEEAAAAAAAHAAELARQEEALARLQRERAGALEEAAERGRALEGLRRAHEEAEREGAAHLEELRAACAQCQDEAEACARQEEACQELQRRHVAAAEQAASLEEALQELQREHAATGREAAAHEEAVAQLRRARDADAREVAAKQEELQEALAGLRQERDEAARAGDEGVRSEAEAAAVLSRAVESLRSELQGEQEQAARASAARRRAASELREAQDELDRKVLQTQAQGVRNLSEMHQAHQEELDRKTAELREALEQSGQDLAQARAGAGELQEEMEQLRLEASVHEQRLSVEKSEADQMFAAQEAALEEAERRHRAEIRGREELLAQQAEEAQRLQTRHNEARLVDQQTYDELERRHRQSLADLVALQTEHLAARAAQGAASAAAGEAQEASEARMLSLRGAEEACRSRAEQALGEAARYREALAAAQAQVQRASEEEQRERRLRVSAELAEQAVAFARREADEELLGERVQHTEAALEWQRRVGEAELRSSSGWQLAEKVQEELQDVRGKLQRSELREDAGRELAASAVQEWEREEAEEAMRHSCALGAAVRSEEACARRLSEEQARAAELEVRVFSLHAELRTEKALAQRADADALASMASSREEECARLRRELLACKDKVRQTGLEMQELVEAQEKYEGVIKNQDRQMKALQRKTRLAEQEALARGGEVRGLREALAGQLQAAATAHERELHALPLDSMSDAGSVVSGFAGAGQAVLTNYSSISRASMSSPKPGDFVSAAQQQIGKNLQLSFGSSVATVQEDPRTVALGSPSGSIMMSSASAAASGASSPSRGSSCYIQHYAFPTEPARNEKQFRNLHQW